MKIKIITWKKNSERCLNVAGIRNDLHDGLSCAKAINYDSISHSRKKSTRHVWGDDPAGFSKWCLRISYSGSSSSARAMFETHSQKSNLVKSVIALKKKKSGSRWFILPILEVNWYPWKGQTPFTNGSSYIMKMKSQTRSKINSVHAANASLY